MHTCNFCQQSTKPCGISWLSCTRISFDVCPTPSNVVRRLRSRIHWPKLCSNTVTCYSRHRHLPNAQYQQQQLFRCYSGHDVNIPRSRSHTSIKCFLICHSCWFCRRSHIFIVPLARVLLLLSLSLSLLL